MADTGVKYANTCTTEFWTNSDNFKVDDAAYATIITTWDSFALVKAVLDSSPVGDNLANAETITSTDTYYTFGGPTELCGLSWSVADINSSGFGLYVSMTGSLGHLQLVDFGFSVPSGATIDGIQIDIKCKVVFGRLNGTYYHNVGRITVYYTEGGGEPVGKVIPIFINQYRERRL